jgi:multidrug efflux pump subunit AcrB
LQPLVVMFAVPFGLIGVILAFALHGQSLGFLAMLGVIGLVGIVVNDSLILVNLANRMRDARPGVPRNDIIVDATKHRLRPILLTSVTTVAGLLPMAYGIGGSDPFSAPMALAMGSSCSPVSCWYRATSKALVAERSPTLPAELD